MPELGEGDATRLVLPSTKGAPPDEQAMVYFRKAVLAGEVDHSVDQLTAFKKVQCIEVVTRHIQSWNYTDREGAVLDISVENVKKMPAQDYHYLLSSLQIGKTLSKRQVQTLILHLENVKDGKPSSYAPTLSWIFYQYRQRWNLSYSEAMKTPLEVMVQDFEYDNLQQTINRAPE